jgi:hypothetical protein
LTGTLGGVVGVDVGVEVGVSVGVGVGVSVSVSVGVAVWVSVPSGVAVCVGVWVEDGAGVAVDVLVGMEVCIAVDPPRGVLVTVSDPEGGEIQPENAEMTLSSEHNKQDTIMKISAISTAKMTNLRLARLSSSEPVLLSNRLNIQSPQPVQIKVGIQHLVT